MPLVWASIASLSGSAAALLARAHMRGSRWDTRGACSAASVPVGSVVLMVWQAYMQALQQAVSRLQITPGSSLRSPLSESVLLSPGSVGQRTARRTLERVPHVSSTAGIRLPMACLSASVAVLGADQRSVNTLLSSMQPSTSMSLHRSKMKGSCGYSSASTLLGIRCTALAMAPRFCLMMLVMKRTTPPTVLNMVLNRLSRMARQYSRVPGMCVAMRM
mmetsp:Transcript_22522/g.49223  ORF Transcript_22522/g.49223 Transcript_22522/m.49223 type:complete len:218 (+) Transcript_22522:1229-1882(+)